MENEGANGGARKEITRVDAEVCEIGERVTWKVADSFRCSVIVSRS